MLQILDPEGLDRRAGAIAILTQQISHYHAARYRAAGERFERVGVISLMRDTAFPEFRHAGDLELETVTAFDGQGAYLDAVAQDRVWPATVAALERLQADVVAVAGWSFPESLAAIAWARRRNVPVLMMSESQERDARRNRLRELLKSRVVGACDAAVVGGRRQRDYIVRLGMAPERVFLGYDAVDNRHFAAGADRARADAANQRRRLGLPERYILASARFVPKKNLAGLIAAFSRAVTAAASPHKLVILGDGEGRAELEQAAAGAGVSDRVLLPGFRDYDSLPAYYGLADAFAHVSLSEQWGLVINEAAAAGLPLVVSDACGAADELVQPGRNGHLVDARDPDAIARALEAVMTADPATRRAMGEQSRAIAAAWGPDRFAESLQQAARTAAGRPRQSLRLWDAALLRRLSRRYFCEVS